MLPLPRLHIHLQPRATLNFDLSHPNYCGTVGIYRNMCLPDLVKIHWTVPENLGKRDFCDLFRPHMTLTFDLLTPKLIVSCPCSMDHLCQFAPKSVHSFSKCPVNKYSNRQTNKRTDKWKILEHNAVWSDRGRKTCKTRQPVRPVRLRIFLTYAPSQVHISNVHKQMLCTSSQFGEDKSRQHIALGVHVEECGRDENTTRAPPAQNQKRVALRQPKRANRDRFLTSCTA